MNVRSLYLILLFAICNFISFSQNGDVYEFCENKGQWNKAVVFKSALPNGWLYLEQNGFTYDFQNTVKLNKLRALHTNPNAPITNDDFNINGHATKVNFIGCNKNSKLTGEFPSIDYKNYLKGNDPKKWVSNVRSYDKVTYQNIYDNINLEVYTSNHHLKYDWIVEPNGNPDDIITAYEGVNAIRIENGNLILQTSVNTLTEQKPYAYQIIDGQKIEVACEFHLKNKNIKYYFPNNYNKSTKLIIDPILIFSSYSGSTSDNFGMTATYDSKGNLLAGGMAYDQGYPTTIGAYDVTSNPNGTTYGITDVVITKYDSTGTNLIYSTFIGGGTTSDGTETVHSLICNDQDELYLFGVTSSNDFPMLGSSYDNSFAGGAPAQFTFNGTVFNAGTDIYVSKLSSDGTTLLGSTYIGGTANDGINYAVSGGTYNSVNLYDSLTHNYGDQFRGEIMLDNQSNVYVASVTRSGDFPINGGFEPNYQGNQDGVVFKLSSNLDNLIWSSFLGGSDKDAGYSIKVDTSNTVYVAGGTVSTDFPTTSGVISENYNGGKVDGFVAKINSSGSTILSATYYGTNDYDQNYFIEIDRFQDVYVIGQTADSMPIVNVNYYNLDGGQFVSKLSNELDSIIYSTAFGNGNDINISPSAFLVDKCQNVYVSGWGANILQNTPLSGMPITSDALLSTPPNGFDFYLIVFKRDIDTLLYASYFGGDVSDEHVDGGTSRFDKNGVIYQSVCAGCGGNDDFPTTTGAWSNDNLSNNCNNGVFKMDFQILPNAEFLTSNVEGCAPFTVNFLNISSSSDDYLWDFGDGDTTSTVYSPTRTYDSAGTYLVKLAVTDSICQLTDTAYNTIIVNPIPFAEAGPNITICLGDSTAIGGAPTGAVGTSLSWDISTSLSDTAIGNPIAFPTGNTLYSVTVTDANNCKNIDSVFVTTNSVDLIVIDSTYTLCDSCIGTATVAPLGGISPYHYLWSDSNNQTGNFADNLCSNTYTISITDSLGCINSTNVLIEDTSNIVLTTASSTVPTCIDSCNATASTLGNGGTTPYTYLWNDSHNQNTNNATGLCLGTYIVTITDYYGCKAFTSVSITNPDSLIIENTVLINNPCYNECEGIASISVTGGTPGYTFQWNDVNNQPNNTATGLCAGVYSITATDQNGCITTEQLTLTEPNELIASTIGTAPACAEICNGEASTTPSGGTIPYDYLWQTGQITSSITGLCPGTYQVEISDANNCLTTESVTINESNFSFGNVMISADEDTIMAGTSTGLHASPEGDLNYDWAPPTSLSDNSAHPIASPTATETYTLTVSDLAGLCVFDTSITITVYEGICENPYIFLPRAFTPNGDQENDVLYVRGRTIKQMNLEIFNRWGQKVFESDDQSIGWDGTYKNIPVDPAVYVYYLSVICIDEQEYFEKGNVTVIR